ncbi:MAG: galactokinase family protein [Myxococcota bacterium]|jgi:galactokinase|nr:galactokinase family protein [Myxococcota bacterium]
MTPPGLEALFATEFGQPPAVVVRAPGRVNLIGEHTDYSLLPVLPLAIDRSTWVAARPTRDGRVAAHSCQFPGRAALLRDAPDAGIARPWHRYLAGLLGQLPEAPPGAGAQLVIDSDLPTTGGLSSSSSFTMAVLGALSHCWDLGLTTAALVARAIVAERHVGVESGGMDQTVIGLATAGAALRIDFAPTRVRAVPLPASLRLVAAYSGEEAPKGGPVRELYNARVVGCRLAATLLAADLGLAVAGVPTLAAVAGAPGLDAAVARLPAEASAQTVADRLVRAVDPLVQLTAARFPATAPVRIRSVARHVLGEAARVAQVEEALLAADLGRAGRLLDEGHASLADDFGCSTPALDGLCRTLRAAGACGARLTGAGFGGYALALATGDAAAPVLQAAQAASGGAAFPVRASAGLTLSTR